MESIYADIAARTGGHIYAGVVGPVRTGKSTLIKKIMETVVIPGIPDPYRRERARDELPQSGSGRTIMTSEPKFVPEEAAEISPDGVTRLRVRFIDSVGYLIPGAAGAEEDGKPRMVTTPWFDHEIPMTQAAELGTKKVMEEHCSLGLVVTTDGTITDIPREDYLEGEKKAITDMKRTGKPFLVLVNSRSPEGKAAQGVKDLLKEEYGVEALVCDCQALDEAGVGTLLGAMLSAFPLEEIRVHAPRWLDALEEDHPVRKGIWEGLLLRAGEIGCLGQAETALKKLTELPQVETVTVTEMDLGKGTVTCVIALPQKLYYEVLSAKAGLPIENDGQLLSLLMELSQVRAEYSKISSALEAVKATGYGVVMPTAEEMTLQAPEIIKKGGAWGVKLKAEAPSIHLVRVDIDTEIAPLVGDENQSRDLLAKLGGEDPEAVWQSNLFGKSVFELIQEGLTAKVTGLPEEVRGKFRGTLTRIVNEGATGLICLIL